MSSGFAHSDRWPTPRFSMTLSESDPDKWLEMFEFDPSEAEEEEMDSELGDWGSWDQDGHDDE